MDDKAALAYAPVTQRASDVDTNGVQRYSDVENAQAPPLYETSLPPAVYGAPPPSARKRFFHAVVIGVLVWLAAGTVVHKLVGRGSGHMYKPWPHGPVADRFAEVEDYPELELELSECLEKPDWSLGPESLLSQLDFSTENSVDSNEGIPAIAGPAFDPPYHANHSFSLPAGADVLTLLARGSLAHGDVRFETGDTADGSVEVNVNVSYWSEDALKHAVVCRLGKPSKHGHGGPPHPGKGIPPPPPPGRDHRRRPEPDHPHPHSPCAAKRHLTHEGIGIFTPRFSRGAPGRNTLRFNITVRLPPLNTSDANATHPVLVTDFANFKHTFEGALTVPAVHVKTSNALVHAEGLSVNRSSIKTSNSPITGSYNVSHVLKLTTSNAPISVDVGMYSSAAPSADHSNHWNFPHERATVVSLKTSNGEIDSHLSLYNTTSDATGAFAVRSDTSNAPSFLSVHAHPAFAPLALSSTTSNKRAGVSLHPSFAGRFVLRTSNAQASVHAAEGVEDPSGAGLERHVRTGKVVGGLTEGRIWWGDEGEDMWERGARGRIVHVKSSNAPIDLRLPDI